nr:hypothetical protein [uncultured Aquabacterium sp.]
MKARKPAALRRATYCATRSSGDSLLGLRGRRGHELFLFGQGADAIVHGEILHRDLDGALDHGHQIGVNALQFLLRSRT